MGSTTDQCLSKKEHCYVVLDQENPALTQHRITADYDGGEDETIEFDIHRSSDICISGDENVNSRTAIGSQPFSDLTKKLLSALLYGVCSFLISIINKIVLTTYAFPSVNILGIGQMLAIIIILKTASQLGVVVIRKISIRNKKMWTLAIIYVCNLMSGLGGTKRLPLPMNIALRRFSIAMTAIGEFYLLNVKQTWPIIFTIIAMIGGSFIAAASDLSFDSIGYLLVMINNFFTAANVIFIKKTIDSREINKHEILFYEALFSILPLTTISYFTNKPESLYNYEHWTEIGFISSFFTSCVMGYLLMFSTVLCTHYNSALTTTIVGSLKNILTTYVGMFIGGDYKFSMLNFVAINISLVGSLAYSYLTFTNKQSNSRDQVAKS